MRPGCGCGGAPSSRDGVPPEWGIPGSWPRKDAPGAAASACEGRAELEGCAFPGGGARVLSGRGAGAGGRRAGCAELRAALGAEQASVLPQVGDVGGPGDLMETKVK